MNWDDPAQRAALIERVGPDEYHRQFEQHVVDDTVEIVNGYRILPIVTAKFGKLYSVYGAKAAFFECDAAKSHAAGLPVGPYAPRPEGFNPDDNTRDLR